MKAVVLYLIIYPKTMSRPKCRTRQWPLTGSPKRPPTGSALLPPSYSDLSTGNAVAGWAVGPSIDTTRNIQMKWDLTVSIDVTVSFPSHNLSVIISLCIHRRVYLLSSIPPPLSPCHIQLFHQKYFLIHLFQRNTLSDRSVDTVAAEGCKNESGCPIY